MWINGIQMKNPPLKDGKNRDKFVWLWESIQMDYSNIVEYSGIF